MSDKAYIRSYLEGIRDERGMYANTATRVGQGLLYLLDVAESCLGREEVERLIGEYGGRLFLSKTAADRAEGLITFASGLVATMLCTPGHVPASGLSGLGFVVSTDPDGRSTLQTDDLLVLGRMVVNRLSIREVTYIGGVYMLSPAGSTVASVLPLTTLPGDEQHTVRWTARWDGLVPQGLVRVGWRVLWLADDGRTSTMNYWQQGDQAYSETFNVSAPGAYAQVANRRYWRLVTGVGTLTGDELGDGRSWHYADLADVDFVVLYDVDGHVIENASGGTAFQGREDDRGDAPQAGDGVVCLGSQLDARRQGAVQISSEGTASVDIFDGINGFVALSRCEVHHWGKDRVRMSSSRFEWTTSDGAHVPPTVFRGEWRPGLGLLSTWGDEWEWDGHRWLCVLRDGQTDEAPGTTPGWWLDMNGRNALHVEIWGANTIVNGQGSVTLEAHAFDGEEDVTDEFPVAAFSWQRTGLETLDAAGDAAWNRSHEGVGRRLVLTAQEVYRRCLIECLVSWGLRGVD